MKKKLLAKWATRVAQMANNFCCEKSKKLLAKWATVVYWSELKAGPRFQGCARTLFKSSSLMTARERVCIARQDPGGQWSCLLLFVLPVSVGRHKTIDSANLIINVIEPGFRSKIIQKLVYFLKLSPLVGSGRQVSQAFRKGSDNTYCVFLCWNHFISWISRAPFCREAKRCETKWNICCSIFGGSPSSEYSN